MKRGRPRLSADDRSVTLSVRLTAKQYDATQKQAERARLSLPDWFRRVITRAIPR